MVEYHSYIGGNMKNINAIIRHKIIEITLAFLIIIVSFPIWQIFGNNNMLKLASSYADSSVVFVDVLNYQNYQFYPMKDEIALKHLVPMNVTLNNETVLSSSYYLVLAVDKSSTLTYDKMKISIDNEVLLLKDLYLKEDSQNYYFFLSKGNLQATNKNIFVNLWIDSDAQKESLEQTFHYKFLNLDNAVLS